MRTNPLMPTKNSSQKVILTYSLVIALCSILLLVWMFLSPSEPGNSAFLGLSLPRLIIAAGFLVAFAFFAALSWRAVKDQGWAEQFFERWFGGGAVSKALAWLAGISFGLGWIGCFLPAYRAGVLGSHWDRLQPVMIFILIVSIATLIVFFIKRTGFSFPSLSMPDVFRLAFILFLLILPVLGIVLYSKYDAYKLEDFWYGAAVPLLASQLIFTVLACVLFLLLQKIWTFKRFDLVVFNTPFFERTLYLSFLIYLHTFFGQNYPLLMAVQAAIFAILAPLVYLIGRSLNMRAVGFVSAIIVALRGINSIAASNLFDTANPKMILTDFPTAIGIALIVLFACEWFKKPEQKWQYALWVGGAIGVTLMLRTNALIFLLFIPLYALLVLFPQWKHWSIACTLMVLAVVAITLPWELRNVARGGILYGPIVAKIQQVIKTRYPTPSGNLFPQYNPLSAVTF